MRFKLLTGIHQEGSSFKDGRYQRGTTYLARGYRTDENGIQHICGEEGQDIIETDNNLLKHNSPGSVRFKRLDDVPETENDDRLSSMTVTKLREFAEGEGIDLGTSMLKNEILETIRGERQLQ